MMGIVVVAASLALGAAAQERGFHGEPARVTPPRFEPHPPGRNPRGPVVMTDRPMRILSPKVVVHGQAGWRHWEHPMFRRPVYYWNWGALRNVTCTAEDSYGDQYPVTESTFPGFGLANMTAIEDYALDRCYAESGQDPSCVLLSCSQF
jgi:hypothetical protein